MGISEILTTAGMIGESIDERFSSKRDFFDKKSEAEKGIFYSNLQK